VVPDVMVVGLIGHHSITKFWRCYMWSRNCLPFRSTWVHFQYLLEFVLLDL